MYRNRELYESYARTKEHKRHFMLIVDTVIPKQMMSTLDL